MTLARWLCDPRTRTFELQSAVVYPFVMRSTPLPVATATNVFCTASLAQSPEWSPYATTCAWPSTSVDGTLSA
jgi:hypothetical protein